MIVKIFLLLWPIFSAAEESLSYNVKDHFPSQVVELERRRNLSILEVRFSSPVRSPFKANNTVWGRLYVPSPHPGFPVPPPCIILLPVLAAPNLWIEERFLNHFLGKGFAVFLIELPYQFHRKPHPSIPSGQVFLARTPKRLAANFGQSVLDVRRAVTWLTQQDYVDSSRLALFGISLGALVGASVYSVDDRLRCAVFLLGGADFSGLLSKSSMVGPFVQKMGISEAELRETFRHLDPLAYRERNAKKPVLLINARLDHVIPKESALKLREAFPRSKQVWIPFGHYSSVLHLPWVRGYVSRYFSRQLLSPN